ncbi:putative WRKY transcription factor 24 [Curcuma longa]|uniref:putative WRKY transcription factor 24 n=1 Tax=Curcuma longa TaxID=136217 RepID=UPI003D9EEDBF
MAATFDHHFLTTMSSFLLLDDPQRSSPSDNLPGANDAVTGCHEALQAYSDPFCPIDGVIENDAKRMKSAEIGCRIGFRTESEVEILDDGYKWRKYGKKSVKNSPNPRNYFRCSREGCGVKKRVERDREDPKFVVTTYDGVHNHVSPLEVCYGYSRLREVEATTVQDWWQSMEAPPAPPPPPPPAVPGSWKMPSPSWF